MGGRTYALAMSFMFRMGFRIPPISRIDHDGPELILRDESSGRVAIKPGPDAVVRDSVRFSIRGEGYSTEKDARQDGERWAAAVALGFVSEFVPPDFEWRRPSSNLSPAMLDQQSASANGDVRVYNDESGLQVKPEYPRPMWGRLDVKGQAYRNASATIAVIQEIYKEGLHVDDRTRLAIDLFSAAEHVAEDPYARFLMLMCAVEALITAGPRPAAQVAVIDALQETLTALPNLDADDHQQLANALNSLRRESIRTAGRRLASTLDPTRYDDQDASKFFDRAYTIRSKLVHGTTGEARRHADDVRAVIGPMLWFVRDAILTRAGLRPPYPSGPTT